MPNNKYIASVGKEKQLRGPVKLSEPNPKFYYDEEGEYLKSLKRYESHIASLPIAFTNVSWLKESDNGKILEEGKDFEIKQDCKDDSCPPFSSYCFHCGRSKGCDAPYIAVHIKDKQPDKWKEKFEYWLINNLQFTSKSNVERIIDHVERYIRPIKDKRPNKWDKLNREFDDALEKADWTKFDRQDKQPERMFTLQDILGVIEFTKNLGYMNGTKIQSAFTPEDILTAFETTKTSQP